MAKIGGSATLYGVLYQILGSIHWASLYFKGSRRSDDLVSAQLVFEPADGGDFQVETATERVVQQWKSRSSGRPWTMTAIVQDVLPDLIRAVDLKRIEKPCTYQFMTEGRCSDWTAAKELFAWMREQGCPVDPLDAIKAAPLPADRFFSSRGQRLSAAKFFRDVVSELRKRTRRADLSPRSVWHLLANLDIRGEILEIEVRAKVDEFITNHTSTPDDIDAVRGRLCNLVLDLASESGKELTPKDFFRMADLDNISLDAWRTVFGRLNGMTAERTRDLFQFDSRYNVRPRPERIDDFPIILLTGRDEQGSPGESGKGKSFALGAIGDAEIGASQVVHAGRALGTTPEMLQTVADFIWKTGFRRTTNITLDALAHTLRDECLGLSTPWLVVLLDDLHSPKEMRRLADFPWRDAGVFLVAATTLDIAAGAVQEFPELVRVIELPDFTPLELKDYLRRRGIRWGEVPPDVRAFLRWPILAQLYCDVSQTNWEPENEYELFQAVWERIRKDVRQVSFPDDQPNLVDIIWDTLCDRCEYPWDLQACRSHGLDSDAVSRLVSLGWVHREKGRVRIRHHRLLNWVVAVALATAFERNHAGALESIRAMVGKGDDETSTQFEGVHLGYVAMDLLWLVCDSGFGRVGEAHVVLDAVAEGRSHLHSDNLYSGLLPTLGVRIISPLVQYLKNKNPGPGAAWIYRVSRALLHIGNRFPHQVAQAAVEMLQSSALGVSSCGVKILKRFHSRVRHALAVYSDQGHEVRSFDCMFCESTISLQKGDRDLYKRWRPMEGSVAASSTKRPEFGLRFGFDRSFAPGLMGKFWRRLRRRPIADPVIVSNEVLGRHGTIFGATGMGKSTLILSLASQVFQSGDGATFLDPAGDLSRDLIRQVPPNRIDDVLYIDVADQRFPFPFNILHAGDANERNLLVDEVLGIFKNIYQRSWGDTLSHQLRMALNAALEIGGSFEDVYNLFTRPEVRQRIVRRIKSKELRQYWEETFPGSSFATRMSIINKLAPIVEHPFLGPILCSRQCAFNADDVIRNRKILIVNLATGTRADYTTEILGTFVVNKLVAAAYRQGNIEDRAKRVRHFFFVDEFQNFMHRASGWDRSLSELRKFNLCLILVTQFVEQVKEDIRAAIFGNVGFLVSFRVGHRDSKILKDEFEGATSRSLLELERGECLVRVGTHAMAVRTELPPTLAHDPAPQIIERMHTLVTELRASEPKSYGVEKAVIDSADNEEESDSDDPLIVETSGSPVLCEFA